MLIYPCCRLCAAVASRPLEIEGGEAMLAEGACASGAAILRFGCVIAHIFMLVLLPVRAWGNRRATLGRAGQGIKPNTGQCYTSRLVARE
jgi:hypothetical protein